MSTQKHTPCDVADATTDATGEALAKRTHSIALAADIATLVQLAQDIATYQARIRRDQEELLALVTQFDAMAHTTGAACLLH